MLRRFAPRKDDQPRIRSTFARAAIARIVRGQTLSIKEKEYIEAARSLGAGPFRIMAFDILPNLLAPLIVYSTLLIPATIVGEAALSFLGVGVLPPTADWGEMISNSQNYYLYGSWWYLVFPAGFLLLTTLAFNLLGYGIRDAMDPRTERVFASQRKRRRGGPRRARHTPPAT